MLLAVTRIPPDEGALVRAAAVSGLGRTEVTWRLAGPLPRVLMADASAERIEAVGQALEEAGFSVVACDPAAAPDDRDRVVPQTLELRQEGFVAVDGAGARHECPAAAIVLIQRGFRTVTFTEKIVRTERKPDVARAILTGGLMLSRKEEKVELKTREERQPFVIVQRDDGRDDVMLYEKQLNYRFLGAQMQPTSRSNLDRVASLLAALAPSAPVDDTIGRPGFIPGLPATSRDPVDLGLFLVTLSHRRAPRGSRR